MPPAEQTNPFYRPIIGAIVGEGAILWAAAQTLTVQQQAVARTNMGLGSAATMTAAGVATTAASSQLVRGDDVRLASIVNKANLVAGKVPLGELPLQTTFDVIEVANQAARLSLSASNVVGRMVKQLDNGAFYSLKTGGTPSNINGWHQFTTPVTIGNIDGLEGFMQTFLSAPNTWAARTAIQIVNFSDVPSTNHGNVAGNLRIGTASTSYLEIAATGLAANFTVQAPYNSTPGTYYFALTTQANGSLPLASVTGLTSVLALKADLVSGKVPLSQLPDIVGNLTVSVPVANQAARYAMTADAARGKIVVQSDNKTSWMLVANGNPSTPTDWLQLGDTEITVQQLVNATAIGISLLTAANRLQALQELELDTTSSPTFNGLYLNPGTTTGISFSVGGSFRGLLPPATMSGSAWMLPNRSGYLAYSPNADGSIDATADPTANTIVRRGSSGQARFKVNVPSFGEASNAQHFLILDNNDFVIFEIGPHSGKFGPFTFAINAFGEFEFADFDQVTATNLRNSFHAGGIIRVAPIPVTSSTTATLGQDHINLANTTYTDPASPVNGDWYSVFVRNGTATIGGTAYSTVGTIIKRSFFNGSWLSHRYLPS